MKAGRNAPCACGSGKKTKRCCGEEVARAGLPEQITPSRSPISLPVIASSAFVKHRNCDGCTACCHALVIDQPELVKLKGEYCSYLDAHSCSRWDTDLPEICTTFLCSYLLEPGDVGVDARPDQIGAILQRGSDRTAMIAAYAKDGLSETLAHPIWRPIILRDLQQGWTYSLTFSDDQYDTLVLKVRLNAGRLGVEMTSFDSDSNPMMLQKPAADGSVLRSALFIAKQNFAFDAASLVGYLGDRESALLEPSSRSDKPQNPIRFRITQRQAVVLRELLSLLGLADANAPKQELAHV